MIGTLSCIFVLCSFGMCFYGSVIEYWHWVIDKKEFHFHSFEC